jgi:ribosomal-protein-alanine N-acetyltransferase
MISPLPTLETARLVLRPLTDADADAVFAACSNPRLTAHTLFDAHRSVADTLTFLAAYARPKHAAGEPDPYGIAFKESPGEVIGCVGARWGSQLHRCMELGYWVAEPHWGRGIVTEAATELVRFVFESFEVERIQSRVFAGNESSARVLLKLGFTLEGTMRSAAFKNGVFRDVMLFARLRSDKA